ncbi:MAG: 3'-5' exonuclease, partial [Gemmatimonadota bacterium]|nr:3'-5' exonuclease [Gemmatimonadota bacterium]
AALFEREDVEDAVEEATDLELYLQSVALRSDLDEADFDGDAVTLMTLHNAKGLEFRVVFLAGLEEGLFPLSRALESDGGLEEERRLFYVGVTRAMDALFLSYADQRWRAGMESRSAPSSFLDELPEEHVNRRSVGGVRRKRPRGARRASGGAFAASARSGGPAAPGGASFSWHREAGSSAHGESKDEPSGLEYDYADSQVPLELVPGARIVHPRFGEGEVLDVSGSGREAKAEIDFDAVGVKKVVVAYAGLRPA